MALPDADIVQTWSTDDVIDWLLKAEFGECADSFRKRNINGECFLALTEESFLLWGGDIKIRQRIMILGQEVIQTEEVRVTMPSKIILRSTIVQSLNQNDINGHHHHHQHNNGSTDVDLDSEPTSARRRMNSVMDIGRNSVAMGRILKRQITRYLNDCRNREPSNQGLKSALKLKRKSTTEPPPVPQPDYTGSVADEDSYDEGWDTDFDEDSEEENDSSEFEPRHQKSICPPDDLPIKTKDISESRGISLPASSSLVGKQIAEIIRKFSLETPPAIYNDKKGLYKNGTACESQGTNAQEQTHQSAVNRRPELPKRKVLPRPPTLPVLMMRINQRPQNGDGASKNSVVRPVQQPPPPPPPAKPQSSVSSCSTPPSNPDIYPDFDQPLDYRGPMDAYEIPTPSQSDTGSMDLHVATSMNSLSISGDSSIQGTSNMHLSLSQSQLDLCQDLVMEEAYEIPDENQWSGSSGVSSSSSDRPALPPKPSSPEIVPPPLPEKPMKWTGVVNETSAPPLPLKDNNRPPLPSRKISDDSTGKVRNRPSLDGCKQAITSLTSMLSNLGNRLTSEKRSDSTTGVDKVTTPDKDLSTLAAATEMTKSYSMLSLRHGSIDGANRPLPPVPGLSKSNTRNSLEDSLAECPAKPLLTNSLQLQPWFHKVEREVAAATLRKMGQSGSYLVRESRRAGESNPYSLTVFYDDKVSHLNIRQRDDDTFALGKEKNNEKTFISVEDLIAYHQREPILLTARGQQIGRTCLVTYPEK